MDDLPPRATPPITPSCRAGGTGGGELVRRWVDDRGGREAVREDDGLATTRPRKVVGRCRCCSLEEPEPAELRLVVDSWSTSGHTKLNIYRESWTAGAHLVTPN